MHKIILLGLAFFCSGIGVHAQFFPVDRFAVEDGLPHSNVFRIYQDHKGFVWFGTEYGLSCFDGKRFVNYTSSEGLSFNTVMSVTETADEKKWVCTYGGGINVIIKDSIRRLSPKGYIPDCVIYSLMHEQRMWIIDKNGELYSLFADSIERITPAVHGENVFFRRIIKRNNGDLLFASNSGLFIYDRKGLRPYLRNIIHETVYAVEIDKHNNTWISGKGKLIRLVDDKIASVHTIPGSSEISDLLADRHGNIWVAAPEAGIFMLTDKGLQNLSSRLKLQNILVNDLFEDRDGNVWIATHGSGVHCVRSLHISNYPVQEASINNYSKAIESYGNKVFISSIGKLGVYEDGNLKPLHSALLSSVEFIYFVKQQGAKLYIGTPDKIIVHDLNNRIKDYAINGNGISFHCDKRGRIWIGRFNGIAMLKNDTLQIIDTRNELNRRRVNDIRSSEGNVYFGTDSGAYVYNGREFRYLSLGYPEAINKINAICVQGRKIWFATDWGLVCEGPAGLSNYTVKDGLSHIRCTSITGDSSGNLWIGTLGGLNRFNEDGFRHFDHKSGLVSNEVLSLVMDEEDALWVGTVNGISRITHEGREARARMPEVYITSAAAGSKSYFFPSAITLENGISSLHIDFSGIDLPRGDKLEFEYQVINQNENWLRTTHNSLDISFLNPGNYQFVLRARSNGEAWSKSAVLDIFVPTPFWKSIWFKALILLTGGSLLYIILKGLILRKEKMKREKSNIESKMLMLKQQALGAQINPHFVFNCLNAIQNYIYNNDRNQANKYLVKFARLIRMTLDQAEDAFIPLERELERLELYLKMEQLRFGEKLSYEIENKLEAGYRKISIPNMILQPYVENAIRHGIMPSRNGGSVKIVCSMVNEVQLQIIIEDNGIGMKEKPYSNSDIHKSMGMQLTSERLKLMEQLNGKEFSIKITDLSGDGSSGTRVSLLLPLEIPSLETVS